MLLREYEWMDIAKRVVADALLWNWNVKEGMTNKNTINQHVFISLCMRIINKKITIEHVFIYHHLIQIFWWQVNNAKLLFTSVVMNGQWWKWWKEWQGKWGNPNKVCLNSSFLTTVTWNGGLKWYLARSFFIKLNSNVLTAEVI